MSVVSLVHRHPSPLLMSEIGDSGVGRGSPQFYVRVVVWAPLYFGHFPASGGNPIEIRGRVGSEGEIVESRRGRRIRGLL